MTSVRQHAMLEHWHEGDLGNPGWTYYTCRCGLEYQNKRGAWVGRVSARRLHSQHLADAALGR